MTSIPAVEELEKIADGESILNGHSAIEKSTWLPIDLGPALSGENPEPRPSLLTRSDGQPLVYKGKITSIAAEPEAGKTKLVAHAVAEVVSSGGKVVWLDFETSANEAVTGLLDLGADPEDIRRYFTYILPDAALDESVWVQLEPVAAAAELVVIDGVTEVFTLHGFNPNDPVDTAKYQSMLTKRIRALGPAVIEIDHVVKNRESRGNWQAGSGHKKAGIDVCLMLTVVKPFGRGVSGSSKLSITKDRPGHLRPLAVNGHKDLALVHYISGEYGALTVRLDPVGEGEKTFRPTLLMERVSRAIEDEPGLTKNGVRSAVNGKNGAKDAALSILVEEDYIKRDISGQAHQHFSVKPYRQEAEE